MNDTIESGALEYLDTDQETKYDIAFYTGTIRGLIQNTASDIIKIGEHLIKVKELLAHGQFGLWLEQRVCLVRKYSQTTL